MNSSDPEAEVGVYLENVDIRETDIALAMKLPAELVKSIDILREGSVEHKKVSSKNPPLIKQPEHNNVIA